jgi:tetratricopeptide (TPR) repeat protein
LELLQDCIALLQTSLHQCDAVAKAAASEAAAAGELGSWLHNSSSSADLSQLPSSSVNVPESPAAAGASAGEEASSGSSSSSSSAFGDVRQAALANLAYAHLLTSAGAPALQAAHSLLDLPGVTPQHRLLGSLYAAHALCVLGNPTEAAEQLSTLVVHQSMEQEPSEQEQQQEQQQHDAKQARSEDDPKEAVSLGNAADLAALTGAAARVTTYINLASIFATDGSPAQARQFVQQALMLDPTNIHALLVLAYVDLMSGDSQAAMLAMQQAVLPVHVAQLE